jgi:hypothetical protein
MEDSEKEGLERNLPAWAVRFELIEAKNNDPDR